ncbi:hypothetical protein HZC21_04505 [Candidatus Peregrinibacteria bacterium]|nr:hypothetical protein [Candidatus Peregrinibacteria bacterium]
METSRPTVTGPDEQGAYGIQDGAETFYMYPLGEALVYEQSGFGSYEDAQSAIALVVSELHAKSGDKNACTIDLGLGAFIRLNAHISSVQIIFHSSPASNGISPLAVIKLTEIRALLASLAD